MISRLCALHRDNTKERAHHLMIHILYNLLAGSGRSEEKAREAAALLAPRETEILDITTLDTAAFMKKLPLGDEVVLSGGDGTINYFINALGGQPPRQGVLYYPAGSGNDFMHDVSAKDNSTMVPLNRYLADLPTVEISGKRYYFVNGVGYGIDGYCCEVGDIQRSEGKKNVNYTAIAIKGLLFGYHPVRATVTVDGKTQRFKHVWLSPAMNGRYYGGGMEIAPAQDRLNHDRTVSVVVMHCASKLKTLAVFPSIFKGEHVKHDEMVTVLTGHDIQVEFDRPTALQIDGETISGVRGYHVRSAAESAQEAVI